MLDGLAAAYNQSKIKNNELFKRIAKWKVNEV